MNSSDLARVRSVRENRTSAFHSSKLWTSDEVRFLRDAWFEFEHEEIAAALGRTTTSIKNKYNSEKREGWPTLKPGGDVFTDNCPDTVGRMEALR
jgi:hypothetical protein